MSADTPRTASAPSKQQASGDSRQEHSGAATRAHILAAAAELAKEKGAAHISLEAIAQRAGLSKGGLLYHFPRKDALIRALVEQHLAEVDAMLAAIEANNGHRRNNTIARAFVELSREKACEHKSNLDGILMALAENPHLLDPIRAHEKRMIERIRRTAADRELSLIALLVIEGMRSLDLFNVNELATEERAAVLDRVMALLGDDQPSGGEGPTA